MSLTPSSPRPGLQWGVRIVIPLVILVLGGGIAFSLIKTAPHPERKARSQQAPLIDTFDITLAKHPVTIEAWGDVQPAHRITLRAQVVGEVIEVSPELAPGGRFTQGDTILRLNPEDYALAVRQRQSDLEKARADLILEQGNQVVAKQEFDLLGEGITAREKALVLRFPQLKTSHANIEAAKAALESAKLALARTVLTAPFDATVLQRQVDLGTYITTNSDIVTLVGTDEYWVELSIAPSQLRWIKIPNTPEELGSPVKLYHDTVWGKTTFRTGHVIRLLTDLETEGRMARVMVAIEDPLNLHTINPEGPKVLLGSYLRAEIQGQEIPQVAKVGRNFIRDGDAVWLLSQNNTLEIRPVTIVYRGTDHVLVSQGLEEGDRLIVTDIPSPSEGILLRPMTPVISQPQNEPIHGN
jgi:RND family efflux transporter MFP subunit